MGHGSGIVSLVSKDTLLLRISRKLTTRGSARGSARAAGRRVKLRRETGSVVNATSVSDVLLIGVVEMKIARQFHRRGFTRVETEVLALNIR